jgi:hypothetical protein
MMVNSAPLRRTLLPSMAGIGCEPGPPVILTVENGGGGLELRGPDALEGAAPHGRNPENRKVVLRNDERGGQLRVVRGLPDQSQSSYERATPATRLTDPTGSIGEAQLVDISRKRNQPAERVKAVPLSNARSALQCDSLSQLRPATLSHRHLRRYPSSSSG